MTQGLVDKAEAAVDALGELLKQVNHTRNKRGSPVLGHVLRSPAITLGVGPQHFTEDYGIFLVKRHTLGEGFQGNKIDLGEFMTIRPSSRAHLYVYIKERNWMPPNSRSSVIPALTRT